MPQVMESAIYLKQLQAHFDNAHIEAVSMALLLLIYMSNILNNAMTVMIYFLQEIVPT